MTKKIESHDGGRDGAVKTLLLGGHTGRILSDEDGCNPREWDNIGTMVCFHRRYELGDKDHGYRSGDFNGWDDMEKAILRDHPGAIILPLYLYDHSGITMSTGPFSCPWDSGQVGLIFVSAKRIREEYGAKRISKKLRERVEGYLRNEVEEYDRYLRGECYGYVIEDEAGEEVDSCWGFLGLGYVTEQVEDQLRHFEKAG
jgi:hypothetical protein